MKKMFIMICLMATLCITGCGKDTKSDKNYTEFSFNKETGETVMVEETITEETKVENIETEKVEVETDENVEAAKKEAAERIANGEDRETVRREVAEKYDLKIH